MPEGYYTEDGDWFWEGPERLTEGEHALSRERLLALMSEFLIAWQRLELELDCSIREIERRSTPYMSFTLLPEPVRDAISKAERDLGLRHVVNGPPAEDHLYEAQAEARIRLWAKFALLAHPEVRPKIESLTKELHVLRELRNGLAHRIYDEPVLHLRGVLQTNRPFVLFVHKRNVDLIREENEGVRLAMLNNDEFEYPARADLIDQRTLEVAVGQAMAASIDLAAIMRGPQHRYHLPRGARKAVRDLVELRGAEHLKRLEKKRRRASRQRSD